jgi:hypothetical protein
LYRQAEGGKCSRTGSVLDQDPRDRLRRSGCDDLVEFIGASKPTGPAGPSVSTKNTARHLLHPLVLRILEIFAHSSVQKLLALLLVVGR